MAPRRCKDMPRGITTPSSQGLSYTMPASIYVRGSLSRLLTSNARYPGGVDGGERIDVMRWLVKKVCVPFFSSKHMQHPKD